MILNSMLPELRIQSLGYLIDLTDRFGISLNLKQIAISQIRNFPFNSMCIFNGVPLVASSNGLFTLDTANNDNGTAINSIVETVMTNLNYLGVKRFRKAYIGYESSGDIKISVSADENNFQVYTLFASDINQKQHRDILPMTRDQKGTYWTFKIENVDGCDFSIDHIEALPVILTKGRK